jgi:hypothetical protein
MSFSFGFEDDDDIEAADTEMRDAPIATTAPFIQNSSQNAPAAEKARSYKVGDLVGQHI